MNRLAWMLLMVVCLVLACACAKKDETPAGTVSPTAEARPAEAKPTAPEIESWALAKALEADGEKAVADYNGKPFAVKNLAVFMTNTGSGTMDAHAYDPASRTISALSACKLNADPLVSSSEYGFAVTFASAGDAAGLRGAHSEQGGGGPISVLKQLVTVEGTLELSAVSNTLKINQARLIKVQ